jgi:effector-binding domain-containing protein
MKLKKIFPYVFIYVLLAGYATAGQEVTVTDMEGFHCASLEFKGSYDQMAANIQKFMQEFFKQGLTPAGPLVGLYFNAADTVPESELRWAIAFPIDKAAEVKTPLRKREFPAGKVAKYLHVGPYSGLGGAYQKIFDFLKESRYQALWPTMDRYLNNPMQVKPEELKTEILVPVAEKK